MGKKYLDTKKGTLESSILGVWKTAIEEGDARMDGRTKEYREHRKKLESARSRREDKKVNEEPVNPKDREELSFKKKSGDTAKSVKKAQEPAPNQMAETNKNDKSDDGEGLDAVQPKAVKKKFKDRKDKDIDNDGDVDDSDKFLHKRRKAVSKAVAKEEVDLDENAEEYTQNAYFKAQHMRAALAKVWGLDEQNLDEHKGTKPHKHPHEDNEVEEGLENSPNPANKQHLCAKNVVHEEWGDGQCIATQHADPDEEGNVAWYDVMFEHGIEKGVLITELKVTKSEDHMHASYNGKKKKKEEVSKTETGKKAAKIDLKPKIDD